MRNTMRIMTTLLFALCLSLWRQHGADGDDGND